MKQSTYMRARLNKDRFWRWGWLGVFVFVMQACQPSPETPALPVETRVTPSETPLPTQTPSPTTTLTVTPTATPTELPIPLYTHVGIEVVGSNIVEKIPMLAEAGAGWVRWNGVSWMNLESEEGVYDWTRAVNFETYFQAVSEAGMQLIVIVRRTPEWAQAVPGYVCGAILPEKLEAFGRFMFALVERYSQPPYNVKYWELGNEPDIDPIYSSPTSAYGCWGQETDPYYGGGIYAEMLKVVYPQIKAADPAAQVLIGGLLLDCDPITPPLLESGEPKDCRPARYVEGILAAGGGAYFDGISFHAYDFYWPNEFGFINPSWGIGQITGLPVTYFKTAYLRQMLSQYGFSEKFLLNTETALLCGRDGKEPDCQTDEFNRTKADYVAKSYIVAKGENLHANIWYHYQQGWRSSGLVDANFAPHPALDAFRFVGQILEGAIPIGLILDYPQVIGYKFIKSDTPERAELWAVWSSSGFPSMITLPVSPIELWDIYGTPLPTAQTLEVTNSPIYIRLR